MIIDGFTGTYRFLSNFAPALVYLDGFGYATVEHAFQAAKSTDQMERSRIAIEPEPGGAKRRGRRVALRPDWDAVRIDVMRGLLIQKFSPGTALGKALLETVCQGVGENHLGRLLMQQRDHLRSWRAVGGVV